MKYTRYAGYGVLLGTSVMMAGNMNVKAEENNRTPIPVEEQTVLKQDLSEETLIIEDSLTDIAFDEDEALIEETKTINEPILTMEQTVVNNGIPVVYLNIDESKGTIEAMNNDPDHNTYCYGTMDLKLPSPNFQYVDLNTDLKEYNGLEMSIKGRGNSSWKNEKKPYKIKLDKKQDFLGLGDDEKNKHWVLIAGSGDSTLLKQRLTADLGEAIGLEYTPLGVPVDVVMNDQYLGSYLLMEHVRVGKGRIDIDELTEDDVSEPDITGGYIVQNGLQTKPDEPGYFQTDSGAKWNNHTPSFNPEDGDYENDIQKNYIRDYFQMVEDLLLSDSQKDADGNSYTAYMDPVSAAKYWWIQTVSDNNDAFESGSTYLYKKRNDILYWGPLWDFDQAWGYPSLFDEYDYQGFDLSLCPWIPAMLYDKSEGSIYQNIIKEWPDLRNILLDYVNDGGMIDQYYEEIKASQAENEKLYPIKEKKTYPEMVEGLKTWIRKRVGWIDEHLNDLESISRKVIVKVDGLPDKVYYKQNGTGLFFLEDPVKEGLIFTGWYDQNGEKVTDENRILSDLVLTAGFVSEEEATKYEEIIFRRDEETVVLSDHPYGTRAPFKGFPDNPEIKSIDWSSSDESIAYVDTLGNIDLIKPGRVTITATVPNGQSFSYILNIVDEQVIPSSVSITETMDLHPGEHRRIDLVTDPVNATIYNMFYSTTNPSIVSVDYLTGTVTALQEGTAKVKIMISVHGEEGQTWRLECIVNVKKEEKQQEIPSENEASQTETIYSYSTYTSKGVPTGIHTFVKEWITTSILSLLASVYLLKKKR